MKRYFIVHVMTGYHNNQSYIFTGKRKPSKRQLDKYIKQYHPNFESWVIYEVFPYSFEKDE